MACRCTRLGPQRCRSRRASRRLAGLLVRIQAVGDGIYKRLIIGFGIALSDCQGLAVSLRYELWGSYVRNPDLDWAEALAA